MASQFYPVRVQQVRQETENAVSIIFGIPPELSDIFRYKPGQYLTLRVMIDGKTFNRAYSLGSSPFAGEQPFVTVKKTEHGFVSGYLTDHIRADDTLHLLPPLGNFTIDPDANASRLYVMFGGGSGITPLFSLIKSVLKQEPNSRITLFYANRDDRNIIFGEELASLEAASGGRLNIMHALETPSSRMVAQTGQMTVERVRGLLVGAIGDSVRKAHYFICGPTGMMQQIEQALSAEQIPAAQIHRELFVAQHDAPAGDPPPQPKERTVGVQLYGKRYSITVATGATILDAAIDQNLDPPYACQVAACCTCRAKLVSGNVQMDNREALTDDELDEGYILTCQSHPLSDDVVVDYDQ